MLWYVVCSCIIINNSSEGRRRGVRGSVEVRAVVFLSPLSCLVRCLQVFPVEEARVVQEFMAQVESEVTSVEWAELSEDALSSEQLLQKLQHLEQLQQQPSCNQDLVETIDQSSHSAEIQRALQRNPDISKERSNLLQGWNNVSCTLQGRVALMRRKALMVQSLEGVAGGAEEGVACYRAHLEVPVPPSALLAQRRTLHSYSRR